jgi:FG-GAP-like repeat
MCRQLLWILALSSVAAAQSSVAGGFKADTFGPAVIDDTHVLGSVPLASGDLNEDGRADLVACDQEAHLMDRFLGQASGGLGDLQFVSLPVESGPFPRPLLGDLTGDGHLDLLVHGTENGTLTTLPGLGDGSFAAAFPAGAVPVPSSAMRLGDLDEDGVLDLLYASGSVQPTMLSWKPGQGDGTFGGFVAIGPAAFPGAIVLADFDLDGTTDVASLDQSSVAVRLGLGGGTFGAPQTYSNFAFSSLSSTDFDLDGLPDLLHGGAGNVATILHGTGGGAFGPPQPVGMAVSQALLTAPADVDRDGFPDVVALGAFQPMLGALRMGPDGPVGAVQLYPVPAFLGTGTLVTADFDGDGLVDVGTTDFSESELITITNALGFFVDLGYGTASTQGAPTLLGFGEPSAGKFVGVSLSGMVVPAPGLLAISLDTIDAPFAGSTFVPDASFVFPVPGTTFLNGVWPAEFPTGVPVYLQSVHAVLGGAKVLSNALMIVPE